MGSVGAPYGNALAEAINGLCKAELIHPPPGPGDHSLRAKKPHCGGCESLGYMTPQEKETLCCHQAAAQAVAAKLAERNLGRFSARSLILPGRSPVVRVGGCRLCVMRNSTDQPVQDVSASVKTVVVPAAGMGTRFLPATKTVPKELLPVVDTPGIELIAEEAAVAGAQRLAVVVAPNKDEIMRHFLSLIHISEPTRPY